MGNSVKNIFFVFAIISLASNVPLSESAAKLWFLFLTKKQRSFSWPPGTSAQQEKPDQKWVLNAKLWFMISDQLLHYIVYIIAVITTNQETSHTEIQEARLLFFRTTNKRVLIIFSRVTPSYKRVRECDIQSDKTLIAGYIFKRLCAIATVRMILLQLVSVPHKWHTRENEKNRVLSGEI